MVYYIGNGKQSYLIEEIGIILSEENPEYPNPPHKHAEAIKAWADGAEIEERWNGDCLFTFISHPTWNPNKEFRVKSQKSDKDIKLEQLEKQARQLADEISKLKS